MISFERHIIFGTAGHVDHGKSSLVFALTGTDPDRLAEEKAREMTIDLGFAFLALPNLKEPAAIVDVPGHEMFVRNMVAGATGIDAAIFVVAADEGVMPQSIEHFDVLRFLKVSTGVVALTKIDKVSPEQAGEAIAEVRDLTKGTFLQEAPIVPVSSVTGEGLDQLRAELARIAQSVEARSSEGIFRLPIDRVFTLKGAGTVVTGTVISGSLQMGEMVALLPQGKNLRVRNLQVHNQSVRQIFAGQRAAINLPDVAKEDLSRGDALVTPGALATSLMADARIVLSSSAPRPIEQRRRVRVHHGTREVMARVVLLEGDILRPGESALVQLRLESPLAAAAGDLFVIRSYSPMLVIGGGSIIDPHPPKRRASAGAVELVERETLPTAELLLEALDRSGARGMEFGQLRLLCGLVEADLRSTLQEMEQEGRVGAGRRDFWFSASAIKEVESTLIARLAKLHSEEPLRTYMPLNQVILASAEEREAFRLALESLAKRGVVVTAGERLRLSNHTPAWTGQYTAAKEKILKGCLGAGLSAPSVQELGVIAGLNEKDCQRVLDALVDAGELRVLAEGIYVHPQAMERSRAAVVEFLKKHGQMNIGQARDLLGASRKYLLPFLEELDREGLTVRQGDYRILRQNPVRPGDNVN